MRDFNRPYYLLIKLNIMIIDGVKPNKKGLYWVNVILPDSSFKLCTACLIDKSLLIFRLQTNGAKMQSMPGWGSVENKPGFVEKEVFKDEIYKFFT